MAVVQGALPEGVELLGHVPYSPALQRADLEGRSVLGVDAKAEAALEEARRKMEALIGAEAPARG